jgi:hypothetical protein
MKKTTKKIQEMDQIIKKFSDSLLSDTQVNIVNATENIFKQNDLLNNSMDTELLNQYFCIVMTLINV